MTVPKAKICVVAATPLTIHFFFKPHLAALARFFDVTLIFNRANDSYLPPLDVPARIVSVGIMRKMSPLRDLVALFGLYRLFRRERFALVVSLAPKAGLLGMLAAWLSRVPRRLHIFQGEVWASRRGAMRRLLKAADSVTARCATQVLAMGAGERDFLESEGVVCRGRARVLGAGSICGVDLSRFRPQPQMSADMRASLGIPGDAIVCLFLGRLNADKGVYELAQAFDLAASRNDSLWLLLAGPDEEGVGQRLRGMLGGDAARRMTMMGYTGEPERILACADLLCLPSYREGFPVTIIEAAACGVPTIGSRIYGIADAIVEGETGLLVPPRDATELAVAMLRLAGDMELRRRLATAGRARVEKDFDQSKVVAGYVDYMRGLF